MCWGTRKIWVTILGGSLPKPGPLIHHSQRHRQLEDVVIGLVEKRPHSSRLLLPRLGKADTVIYQNPPLAFSKEDRRPLVLLDRSLGDRTFHHNPLLYY